MDLYCAYLFKFDLWIKFASKKSVTTIKMTIKVKLLPLFIFCFYSLPISGINDFCNLKGLCEVINKSVSIQMRCSSHVLPNSEFKICTNFRTNQLYGFSNSDRNKDNPTWSWVHFPSDWSKNLRKFGSYNLRFWENYVMNSLTLKDFYREHK